VTRLAAGGRAWIVAILAVGSLLAALTGVARAADPLQWSETPGVNVTTASGLVGLQGFICPTTSFCIGTGGGSQVVITTTPTGPASGWITTDVAGGATVLPGYCDGTNFCLASGSGSSSDSYGIYENTDPVGDPGAWTEVLSTDSVLAFPPLAVPAPRCVWPAFCIAGFENGDVLSSSDTTDLAAPWSSAHINDAVGNGETGTGPEFVGLACPSAQLCVAAGANGELHVTTDPTGPATTWSTVTLDASTESGLSGLSCPTTSLCVATDSDGDIFTTTDPTGPAQAWTTVDLGVGIGPGIDCPSAGLCVIPVVGGVIATSDPTGPAADWEATQPYGSLALPPTVVSCPSVTLCVAPDPNESSVLIGTSAAGAPGPVVSHVFPSHGRAYSLVVVSGSHLRRVAAVRFGNVAAPAFLSLTRSLLVALAPPQPEAGPVDVTVTTSTGTSPLSAGDVFTYRAPRS